MAGHGRLRPESQRMTTPCLSCVMDGIPQFTRTRQKTPRSNAATVILARNRNIPALLLRVRS